MSTEWKRNEILVIVDAYDAHIKLYIDEIVQAKGDEDLKKMFEKIISKEKVNKKNGHDTVGAVAIDKEGNLACATSTGKTGLELS